MNNEQNEFLKIVRNHGEIPLWGEMTPPDHREGAVFPTIRAYLVDDARYAAVIFPGGGYFQLSVGSEGVAIAKALNEKGISAFVVTYRYAPCDRRAILADGQRAMQLVRYHAELFGVEKKKLALIGFSAGGHLAVCVSEQPRGAIFDEISREDTHPDACVLGYPVVTLGDGTFPTMPRIFLGKDQGDVQMIEKYSYLFAPERMPPTFLWYSRNDTAVDYLKNAEALAQMLRECDIPTECHGFSDGAHGIGLGRDFSECSRWLDIAVDFLDRNLLK